MRVRVCAVYAIWKLKLLSVTGDDWQYFSFSFLDFYLPED